MRFSRPRRTPICARGLARGGCRSGSSISAPARGGNGGSRIPKFTDRFSGVDELLEPVKASGAVVEVVDGFPLR